MTYTITYFIHDEPIKTEKCCDEYQKECAEILNKSNKHFNCSCYYEIIPENCEYCKWFLVDNTVGITGECECDQWAEGVTEEEIEGYRESNGENCPEFKFE